MQPAVLLRAFSICVLVSGELINATISMQGTVLGPPALEISVGLTNANGVATMRLMKTKKASIYDFPNYYDLVFGSDTAAELKFLKQCFEEYVDKPVKRLFEPACGTGRLIYRFAREGYEVSGNDLNAKAIEYCNARFEKYGLEDRAFVGDMSDFTVKRKFDAGFNTINSFRHLPSEESAQGHLKCMAGAIRKGGIYALGLHLTPTQGEPTDEEQWSARRGQLAINTYMWPVDKNPRKRLERFGIRFDIYKPTEQFRIDDVLELRSYTTKQFVSLLESVSEHWEVMNYFDFAYDISAPIELSRTTEDVIVILKRR